MARRRYPPTDPREWLNRAKSNLALAQSNAAGALLEDLCFEAQQAAEKAVKAVFVHRGLRFPRIHDLDKLLSQLRQGGVKIPKYVVQADELSAYAVLTRYPALLGPVSKRQHRRAIRIAKAVVHWAELQIDRPRR
jgi:HEPN domain-containing protein